MERQREKKQYGTDPEDRLRDRGRLQRMQPGFHVFLLFLKLN
jgi:hypothetical protein